MVFNEFSVIKRKFKSVHNQLSKNIDEAILNLKKAFPNFDVENIPIHICHSLGYCNGGGRTINNQLVMIIGIDA